MFLIGILLILKVGAAYEWNTTILQIPPWPLSNCQYQNEPCKDDEVAEQNLYDTCKSLDNCSITVAVIIPGGDYIVNIAQVNTTLASFQNESDQLQPSINFTVEYYDDQCKQEFATVNLIKMANKHAHFILGPVCDYCLASVSRIAKYLGFNGMPVLTPGGFTYAFSAEKTKCSNEYFMTINTGPTDFRSFGEFFRLMMERYQWKKIALMYEKDEQVELAGDNTCKFIMESVVEEAKNVEKLDFQDGDLVLLNQDYRYYLEQIVGVNYGIILTCTSSKKLRKFAIDAYKMNMMESGEYTVFNFETYNTNHDPSRPWYDPNDIENNDIAKIAFRSIFTFTPFAETNFSRVANQQKGSIYLDALYDGMQLYVYALNKTLIDYHDHNKNDTPRGYDIVKNMMGAEFKGRNGQNVKINCNGQRVASYALLQMNSSDQYNVVAVYTNENKTISSWNVNWLHGDPSDTPKCGYDMSLCPTLDTEKILLISLILVLCLGILIVAIILYRHFKLKRAIYSMAWKVNYDDIVLLPIKPRSSFQSTTSLRRGSQLV